ncbi:MAG: DUF11 domain-containing protein [Anaerolineae bacterium]|nr:DUF11 domain-containing protein [Anaerolineae bacterium]
MLHHPSTRARSCIPILLLTSLIITLFGIPGPAQAQDPPAQECFTVADGGDALWHIDPVTGITYRIGSLGAAYRNVEAIALNLDATILYAADDNDLYGLWGTLNVLTGAFTPIGAIGPANGIDPTTGLATTDNLEDVDSLSLHPLTGDMWAITQDSGENKIFRIDMATGAVIPNTFGSGLDYAQIVLPPTLAEIDDLGIDPLAGRFYFIANNDSGNDHLYRLDIDGFDPPGSPGLNAATGTISATVINQFELVGSPGTYITDMEGIAFYNDGTFYGTTGDQASGAWDDYMWQIDPATARVTAITPGPIDNDGISPSDEDFESVACLSAGINIKTGIVFADQDYNGVFDGTDTAYAGVVVYFYQDNGNGTFDGALTDTLIQTAITGADGVYRFEVAAEGIFFVVIDPATLPADASLSTVGAYTVNFANFANNLTNNNFGFGTQPPPPPPTDEPDPTATPTPTSEPPTDPDDTPVPAGWPVVTKSAQPSTVLPGELVTFTITVSNPTQTTLTNVVITDTLDATFFDAVVEVATTKGMAIITGPLSIRAEIGTLAPGESALVTVVARVRADLTGPKSTENVAVLTSNEYDPLAARALVSLITLPSTGYAPAAPDHAAFPTQTALIATSLIVSSVLVGALWLLRRRASR